MQGFILTHSFHQCTDVYFKLLTNGQVELKRVTELCFRQSSQDRLVPFAARTE